MKLFQYDKKVWDEGEIDHTWQFGIFNNRSLFWINYQTRSNQVWSSGGLHVTFSLFANSLFGLELYPGNKSFSIYCFTEYFDSWN